VSRCLLGGLSRVYLISAVRQRLEGKTLAALLAINNCGISDAISGGIHDFLNRILFEPSEEELTVSFERYFSS
jgi:hypothetical protein